MVLDRPSRRVRTALGSALMTARNTSSTPHHSLGWWVFLLHSSPKCAITPLFPALPQEPGKAPSKYPLSTPRNVGFRPVWETLSFRGHGRRRSLLEDHHRHKDTWMSPRFSCPTPTGSASMNFSTEADSGVPRSAPRALRSSSTSGDRHYLLPGK